MIPIIITGHGKFASAMEETVKYIFGEQSNLYFVDFANNMKRKELEDRIEDILKKLNSEKVIFLTDLLGGTPFLTAISLSKNNPNYRVFSGCNMPMIIASIELSVEGNLEIIDKKILSYAKEGVVLFRKNE